MCELKSVSGLMFWGNTKLVDDTATAFAAVLEPFEKGEDEVMGLGRLDRSEKPCHQQQLTVIERYYPRCLNMPLAKARLRRTRWLKFL